MWRSRMVFFANVELRGWYRVFMMVFSVLGMTNHVHHLSLVTFRRVVCGSVGTKEKILKAAMEDFERWKKARQEDESEWSKREPSL